MSNISEKMSVKADTFRRYLDENAVTKTLSQILVMLYRQEEKPEDPLRYVKDKLINDCTMDSCIGQLRSRILKATEEQTAIQSNMQNLREQNNTLRQAIEKLTQVIGSAEIPSIKECPGRPVHIKSLATTTSSRTKKTVSCNGSVCTLRKSSSIFVTRFPEIMDD